MKRDLLFVGGRLAASLYENRLSIVARQHGIKKATDSDSIGELFAAYLRRAEESALGGLLVEITHSSCSRAQNATEVLRDAAAIYKVDVDAISLKVKQEFATKAKNGEPRKLEQRPKQRLQRRRRQHKPHRVGNALRLQPGFVRGFLCNATGASAPRRENPLWFLPDPHPALSGLRSLAAIELLHFSNKMPQRQSVFDEPKRCVK